MATCPHCGAATQAASKPRSPKQHRRYFAVIKLAFDNWDERHDFQPESADHLRRWLQCRAGYYSSVTIDTATMTPAAAVAAVAGAVASAGEHVFIRTSGTKIKIIKPQSIAFEKLPQSQATAVFDAVSEVVFAETGLSLDAARLEAFKPPKYREVLRESSLN